MRLLVSKLYCSRDKTMRLFSETEIIEGIFKAEQKNRFLCTVCIDGEDTTCYIPSSCKLDRLIDLKNKSVLLKKNRSPKARTEYALVAVKHGRHHVLLNLAQANQVIEDQLTRRFFSFLGKRKSVSHETYVNGYRSDLFIHDTNTIVEIKTLLSFERTGLFPTVYSERSIEQLRKLSKLLDVGYKVCYLVVSLSPTVREIKIDKAFREHWELFQECLQKGMDFKAVSIRMNNGVVEV